MILAQPEFFNAPDIFANIDLLNLPETDPRLNARIAPEWPLEGLQYKDLIGNGHPWCMLDVNADLRKIGAKGTGSAAASSLSLWGYHCPYWFGCKFDIEHKSGHRHAARYLYTIDAAKHLYATLDGNRENRFGVNVTDLSGHGDRLVTGPRWSNEMPPGMFVSMIEVLARYPQLKPRGLSVGGSTT